MCSIDTAPINHDTLKQVELINIKGYRHMTSLVGNKRQPLSCQSNCQEISGALQGNHGKICWRIRTVLLGAFPGISSSETR